MRFGIVASASPPLGLDIAIAYDRSGTDDDGLRHQPRYVHLLRNGTPALPAPRH